MLLHIWRFSPKTSIFVIILMEIKGIFGILSRCHEIEGKCHSASEKWVLKSWSLSCFIFKARLLTHIGNVDYSQCMIHDTMIMKELYESPDGTLLSNNYPSHFLRLNYRSHDDLDVLLPSLHKFFMEPRKIN
jgi:hypothetical protein